MVGPWWAAAGHRHSEEGTPCRSFPTSPAPPPNCGAQDSVRSLLTLTSPVTSTSTYFMAGDASLADAKSQPQIQPLCRATSYFKSTCMRTSEAPKLHPDPANHSSCTPLPVTHAPSPTIHLPLQSITNSIHTLVIRLTLQMYYWPSSPLCDLFPTW